MLSERPGGEDVMPGWWYGPQRPELVMRVTLATPVDHREYEELARGWLESSAEALAAERFAALEAAPPLMTKSLNRHFGAVGEPGTLWGLMEVLPEDRRRTGPAYAWSPKAWRRFQDRHLADRPRDARLSLTRLNNKGSPGAGDLLELEVSYGILGDEWVDLNGRWLAIDDAPVDVEALAQRWARFYLGYLDSMRVAPEFGCVADDTNNAPCTPLEDGLRFLARESLQLGVLRGYSWITTLPPRLVLLLGGVDALERSGAFFAVHPHPSGAVSVQATELLADYDEPAWERVFEVLAPVLPLGVPIKDNPPRSKLVYRDAAEVAPRTE